MSKHFRTTSTIGTSNTTTGARCNVPPPCQRRVAGNAFSTSCMVSVPLAPTVHLCEMTTNRRMHLKKKEQRKETTSLGKNDHNQPAPTRIHTMSRHKNTYPRPPRKNTCETRDIETRNDKDKNTSDLPPTTFPHCPHATHTSVDSPFNSRRQSCQTWWLRHARVTHEEIAQMHS